MIKIDRMISLYVVIPFFMLGELRIMFWLSGAEWIAPGMFAIGCLIFGVFVAAITHVAFVAEGISWGYWRISREPDDD